MPHKCFELGKIFTGFWELGDKNVQDAYLHGLIRVRKVARRRPHVDSGTSTVTPRSASYVYRRTFLGVIMDKQGFFVKQRGFSALPMNSKGSLWGCVAFEQDIRVTL